MPSPHPPLVILYLQQLVSNFISFKISLITWRYIDKESESWLHKKVRMVIQVRYPYLMVQIMYSKSLGCKHTLCP